jgi:serine/threonine protein kinase
VIAGRIGLGRIWVVYRVIDEELGRHVALKFLPEGLAGEPDATERFLRETRAASALDHLNNGSIFGVEETVDGRRFLVIAYYERENPSQRMRRGVPRDEAIGLAIQVTICPELRLRHRRSRVQ